MTSDKNSLLVVAAFIAAFASIMAAFLASSAQRKNSVGQMRERWIENLRNELADLMSVRFFFRHLKDPEPEESAEIAQKFNAIRNRILLRLNMNEKLHVELSEAVEHFRKIANKVPYDAAAYEDAENKLRCCARKIFRREWKRAANGEIE